MQMQYEILKAHIKNKVGLNKFYDAIPKLKLPQKKHTHSSIKSLMINTTQGSGTYRKIISKAHKISDVHNPSKWRAKLGDSQISRSQLKQARINLHSKYLGSDTADILTRLKLGKTLFGTQLYRCGIFDTPYCNTCLRELNEEISRMQLMSVNLYPQLLMKYSKLSSHTLLTHSPFKIFYYQQSLTNTPYSLEKLVNY